MSLLTHLALLNIITLKFIKITLSNLTKFFLMYYLYIIPLSQQP